MTTPAGIALRRAKTGDNVLIRHLQEQIAAIHYAGRPDIFKPAPRLYDDNAFATKLADPNSYVFIAEADNTVCGYVFACLIQYRNHSAYNDIDSFYIDDICVDAAYRGLGVGRALFEQCRREALALHCHNIDLGVWAFNSDAVAFYREMGMSERLLRMEQILDTE